MRIIRVLFFTVLIYSISTVVYAQWDAQVSQYWRTKTYFNPSFAGSTDSIQASVLHRMQWIGINNAPRVFIASIDMPVKFLDRKHGVGVIASSDSRGLFKNMFVGGQYVFKKTWKKGTLNIGVQAGYMSIGFDANGIYIPKDLSDYEEDIPTTAADGKSFDAGLGISWTGAKYYVGLSSTHLTQPKFDLDDNTVVDINRLYYLTAGYNLRIGRSKYELQPSVLVKTDTYTTQYDLTARIVYNKMFNGGFTWRKDDGFIILLGANILGFDVGYAYDMPTSEISKISSGSHEFVVRYSLPMKFSKKKQYSHKSIRLL